MKRMTTAMVIMLVVLSSFPIIEEFPRVDATPVTHHGDLVISDGSTYYINGTHFKLDGNLILNQSSRLEVHDSILEFLQDTSHKYTFTVEEGAQVYMFNSTVTVSGGQLSPWLKLNFNITDSTCEFEDSLLKFPGMINAIGSTVLMNDTVLEGVDSVPSGLPTNENDDCPILYFNNSQVVLTDTDVSNLYDLTSSDDISIWPEAIDAADTTGEAGVDGIKGNDDDVGNLTDNEWSYTVGAGERLATEGFNISGLNLPTPRIYNPTLWISYMTEPGYTGTWSVNLSYHGGAFAQTSLVPSENLSINSSSHSLANLGITLISELADIDIIFDNNCGSNASVMFEQIWIQFTPEVDVSNILVVDSSLTAINCHFDINYLDTHMLSLRGNSKAWLYALSLDTAGTWTDPPFKIADESPEIYIHRWLRLNITDASGTPLVGADTQVVHFVNLTPIAPPRSEVLTYLGKTMGSYKMSDNSGLVTHPLLSDMVTFDDIPNSQYVGNYKINITYGTTTTQKNIDLPSFPSLSSQDNNRYMAIWFPDLLVHPYSNPYYSSLPANISVSGATQVLEGAYSVKDGLVYQHYYGASGSIVVKNGGTLKITNTTLELLQTQSSHYYIVVESGATLMLINSTLKSDNGVPLTVYLYDDSSLISKGSTLNTQLLVARNTSTMEFLDSTIIGGINAKGDSRGAVQVALTNTSMTSGSLLMENMGLTFNDCVISTSVLDLKKVDLNVVNMSLDRQMVLKQDTKGNLTNLQFTGSVPNPKISVTDTSYARIYWWVRARVFDQMGNPLEGARVMVYSYNSTLGLTLYKQKFSGLDGNTTFEVLSKTMSSTGSNFVGNYKINASYAGLPSTRGSPTRSTPITVNTGIFPVNQNIDVNITVPGGPDLTPTNLSLIGMLVDGNPVSINATIDNIGEFNATDFKVRFFDNGNPIPGDVQVAKVAAGDSAIASKQWTAVGGSHTIQVVVDATGMVAETDEMNNNLSSGIIVTPPAELSDLVLIVSTASPMVGEDVILNATVFNYGGTSLTEKVTVRFYDGLPGSGVLINESYIPAFGPESEPFTEVTWVAQGVGPHTLTAVANSSFNNQPLSISESTNIVVQSKPDLMLDPSSINFSPSFAITNGSNVEIWLTVYNEGDTEANDVVVSLYDGDPDDVDGTFIKETLPIAEIGGHESESTFVNWVVDIRGFHNIYAVVDSEDDIDELNESNNKANTTLIVLDRADLTLERDDIILPPSSERVQGRELTLSAYIWNMGGTSISSILVRFYMDSMNNQIGGDQYAIQLSPGDSRDVQVKWTATPGPHTLYVVVDPENQYKNEIHEMNNMANASFTILKKADLTFKDMKVGLNPSGSLAPEQDVNISVQVINNGEMSANGATLQFFDGNPDVSGVGIGEPLTFDVQGGGMYNASVHFNTTSTGWHNIFVVLDRGEMVDEAVESNNIVNKTLFVLKHQDLVLSPGAMRFLIDDTQPNKIFEGSQIEVSVWVENRGGLTAQDGIASFYLENPMTEAGALDPLKEPLASVDLGDILPLENTTVNFNWTPSVAGEYSMYLYVECSGIPSEVNLANNLMVSYLKVLSQVELPDYTFESGGLSLVDSTVVVEKETWLKVSVENLGPGSQSESNITLNFFYERPGGGEIHIGSAMVPPMAPTENHSAEINWTPDNSGSHTIIVRINDNHAIPERDESNNLISKIIWVEDKPDLVASEISLRDEDGLTVDPDSVMDTAYITIVMKVKNNGNFILHGVDVRFEDGIDVFTRNDQSIDLGQEITIEFTKGEVYEAGSYSLRMDVDYTDEVDETNEANSLTLDIIVLSSETTTTDDGGSGTMMWLILIIIIIAIIGVVVFLVLRKKRGKDSMAECGSCGGPLDVNDTICPNCGAEFGDEVECGKCGAVMSITMTKCPSCGSEFEEVLGGGKDQGPSVPGKASEAGAAGAAIPKKAAKPLPIKKDTPAPGATPAPKKAQKSMENIIQGIDGNQGMEDDLELGELEGMSGYGGAPGMTIEPAPMQPDDLENSLADDEAEEAVECFECGFLVSLTASKCPNCGIEFD